MGEGSDFGSWSLDFGFRMDVSVPRAFSVQSKIRNPKSKIRLSGSNSMSKKFIPNGDQDFAEMAYSFAQQIAADPGRFEVTPGDADALSAAVAAYRAALQVARFGERSAAATRAKEDARAEAERIIRNLGSAVRSNPRLDAATKITL